MPLSFSAQISSERRKFFFSISFGRIPSHTYLFSWVNREWEILSSRYKTKIPLVFCDTRGIQKLQKSGWPDSNADESRKAIVCIETIFVKKIRLDWLTTSLHICSEMLLIFALKGSWVFAPDPWLQPLLFFQEVTPFSKAYKVSWNLRSHCCAA